MNPNVLFFTFVLLCVNGGRGEGFFSKLFNKGKSETDYVKNESDNICETVRTMPRIAMAVVGGVPMQNEISAPYIAAIGDRSSDGKVSWFCGGSLLSSKDVLTAAHCLISRNATLIRVGSFSAKQRLTGNDYEVSETIIHPSYKITESYHDIAVVKIKDRISFTKNIKPVCLPQDDRERYERARARVVGWGAEEFGGEGTQRLQQVEVEVFSNSKCEKDYSNSTIAPKTFPKGIKKQQLCAGSSKGGKDACQGDSGGPLVLTDGDGIIRQIGVVSTGAGCGFKQYPGVYTRVSSYYDWIQEQIKKGDSNKATKTDSKRTDSRDPSGNGNERLSQYKKDPAHDQPSSQNHSSASKNQKNQNKKYQSREQNSAEVGHHNQPTGSLHGSQKSKSSHSGSDSSSRPFHSQPSSNSGHGSLLSMSSQSHQSSNPHSSHQISNPHSSHQSSNPHSSHQSSNPHSSHQSSNPHSSHQSSNPQSSHQSSNPHSSHQSLNSQQKPLRSSDSGHSSKLVQPQNFGTGSLVNSQYSSSHPAQTSQSFHHSNSRRPSVSQTSQSSYQSSSHHQSSSSSSHIPQSSYQSNYEQSSFQSPHQPNYQQSSFASQIPQSSYQAHNQQTSFSQIPQSSYPI